MALYRLMDCSGHGDEVGIISTALPFAEFKRHTEYYVDQCNEASQFDEEEWEEQGFRWVEYCNDEFLTYLQQFDPTASLVELPEVDF